MNGTIAKTKCHHNTALGPVDIETIELFKNGDVSRLGYEAFGISTPNPDDDRSILFLQESVSDSADDGLCASIYLYDKSPCDADGMDVGVSILTGILHYERSVHTAIDDGDDPVRAAADREQLIQWRRDTLTQFTETDSNVTRQVEIIEEALRSQYEKTWEKRPCAGLVCYAARLFLWSWLRNHHEPVDSDSQFEEWMDEYQRREDFEIAPVLIKEREAAFHK